MAEIPNAAATPLDARGNFTSAWFRYLQGLTSGSSGPLIAERITTSPADVVAGSTYIISTNGTIIVLPATATGTINFVMETAVITGCVVQRNGNTIMQLAEDMTIDDNRPWFWGMTGDIDTNDWRIS